MFDKQALKEAYLESGVENGGIVYVTGNLGRLGFTSSPKVGKFQTMEDHLDVLLDIIGPDGTIVVPTHSWSVSRDDIFVFDPLNTPCDYTFSEFVRTQLNVQRTEHCFASIAAFGPDAAPIVNAQQNKNPYGLLSPFDMLVGKNALHVSIGMPVRSTISAVHHCELLAQVPYRYIKEFQYKITDGNTIRDAVCYLYVHYLKSDLIRDKNIKIFSIKENADATRNCSVARGYIETISLKIFTQATVNSMLSDPYIWLRQEPKIKPWNL